MTQSGWGKGSLVAFTEGEGPGRPPPAGARGAWLALAGSLAAVYVGIMFTDTLCPEHRAWVELIGTAALVAIFCAVVGLMRGWAAAPVLAAAAALGGVAIGIIDAVHDPTRGRVIAVAFGVLAIAASAVSLRVLRVAWWERSHLDAAMAPPAMHSRVKASEPARSEPTTADDSSARTSPIKH